MKIEYRKADITDSELLIDIYNFAFYSDYIKYGECPAYGKTKEMMEKSIIEYPKFIILYNGEPVGCVSCKKVEMGIYEVGCLCVVPEFQGKGIGTQAIRFVTSHYRDWDKITLVTPIDKKENVKFYTEKQLMTEFAAGNTCGDSFRGLYGVLHLSVADIRRR